MNTETDRKEDKAMNRIRKTRQAHDVLNGLSAGRILSRENEQLLRSFLPELPKQKTLEEIIAHVYDAWIAASGDEWGGNEYDPDVAIEDWLSELHTQLQGVKDTPIAVPALPAGMRIAVHAVYGRVVVSPVVDDDGTCKIFHLSTHTRDGSDYCWAPIDSLTFIDYEPAEPAKPAHPEFLETEADYQNAPEGTIVACDDSPPCHKFGSEWSSVLFYGMKDDRGMSRAIRRVLRWGNE